jgi:PAS domain S-box-containing protein
MHFYNLHPEEGREAFKAAVFAVVERMEPFRDVVHAVETKDGRIVWGSTNGVPLLNTDGTLRGYGGSCTDITERMEAEERRREYENAIEGAEEMITVVDRHHRYVIANRAFLKHRNMTREQVVGRPVPEVLNKGVYESLVKEKLDESFQGKVIKYEMKYTYPEFGERELFVSYLPIEGPTGVDRIACILQDITDRKRMEQVLRESEEALREAQRVAQVGSWTQDVQTNELTWSDEMYRIHSRDPNLGPPSSDELARLFTTESWERLTAAREAALQTGHVADHDLELIRPDGSHRWIYARGEVETDESGRPVRFRGIAQDITERRRANEELQNSEVKYRTLVETTGTGYLIIDSQGKVLDANQEYVRLSGHGALREILGRSVIEWTAEKEKQRNAEAVAQCAKDGFIRNFVTEYVGGKGQTTFIEVNATVEGKGESLRIVSLCRDVTERKAAERALRETEGRFRTIANTAPVMIWMSGPDKLCTYFNKPWLDFTGRPVETQLGNGWTEGVHPDDLSGCMATYSQSFDRREPFRIEYRLKRHDGEYRWIVDVGVPRFEADGSFAGYIGSCVDDTEHREGVEALRTVGGRLIQGQEQERKRIARELHDHISQRLAMLAFELQQLQSTPRLSAGQRNERIGKLFKYTNQLASEIQALSHSLHSASLEYLGLVPAIQGFCDELAKTHKVTIDFVHSGVSNSLSADVALALFRVTQEALHNAVKYSGVRKFEVRLLGTPDQIQLTIRDSGVGFGPEAAMHGHGLGLISMRERIVPLKGTISIVSKPKHGTEITVRVPVEKSG